MKRAVLVGIDDYPRTHMDLESSVNDLKAWDSLLMECFCFKRENIRLLSDDRAKKEEVLNRLKWLKSGAKSNDTLLFLFSGHGSRFTERDDYGYLDEEQDEALCLAGYDLLVDDELNQIFSTIFLDVNLLFICDCCYSGGINNNAKFHPPPIDIAHRTAPDSSVRPFGRRLTKSLLFSACDENEEAAQVGEKTNGLSVFSFYAIQTLRSSKKALTASELREQVEKDIKKAGYSQTPQLKGREDLFDKPLFSMGNS